MTEPHRDHSQPLRDQSQPPRGYAIGLLRRVDVNDEILDYMSRIEATMQPYGGRWLVHGTRPEPLEGEWGGDVVVIEFPDPGAARRWYDSAAYQEILPLRTRNSTADVLLVEGVPPGYTAEQTVLRLRG